MIYDSVYGDPWGISKIAPEFDYHVYRQVIVESMVSTFYQNLLGFLTAFQSSLETSSRDSSGIKVFSLPEKATNKEREFLEVSRN